MLSIFIQDSNLNIFNSVGIDFLTDWNGEEIFECINTEEIIDEHNKYLVSKQALHAENYGKVNQINFQTPKPPKISSEVHMLAEIVSKPSEIPLKIKEATASNCDNVNLMEGKLKLYNVFFIYVNYKTFISMEMEIFLQILKTTS